MARKSGRNELGLEINPQEIQSCRICLLNAKEHAQANNDYLTPCNCSGSIGYVHRSCILKWINQNFKRDLKKRKRSPRTPKCQICKESYKVKIEKKRRIRKCSQLKKLKNTDLGLIILTLMLIAACLGASGFFLKMIASGDIDINENNGTGIGAIVGICLLFIFATLLCIAFILKFMTQRQMTCVSIQDVSMSRSKIPQDQKKVKYKQKQQNNSAETFESHQNLRKNPYEIL